MLQYSAEGSQEMVSRLWIHQAVWRSSVISRWEIVSVEDAIMEPPACSCGEENS